MDTRIPLGNWTEVGFAGRTEARYLPSSEVRAWAPNLSRAAWQTLEIPQARLQMPLGSAYLRGQSSQNCFSERSQSKNKF